MTVKFSDPTPIDQEDKQDFAHELTSKAETDETPFEHMRIAPAVNGVTVSHRAKGSMHEKQHVFTDKESASAHISKHLDRHFGKK